MRLSEVIRSLEENPKDVFITKGDVANTKVFVNGRNCITFVSVDTPSGLVANVCLDGRWKKARESVDFITAIKALKEGKNIYVEYPDGDRYYFEGGIQFFEDSVGLPLAVDEVLYYSWYIEG